MDPNVLPGWRLVRLTYFPSFASRRAGLGRQMGLGGMVGILAMAGTLVAPLAIKAGVPEAAVVERGPHHAVWQRVREHTRSDGQVESRTNSYIELATGLNYFDKETANWVPSRETIDVVAEDGVAIARHGQHQVTFAGNANSPGAIEILSPDGKRFRTHILGLAYTDRVTGEGVMFSVVKDSQGLVARNQVYYLDAFTDGVLADIRCTWTLAGFESDVLIRGKLPRPEEWGLDPERVVLEVYHEFLEAPVPAKQRIVLRGESDIEKRALMTDPDLSDDILVFGSMRMDTGNAFPMDGNGQAGFEGPTYLTGKSWEIREGRQLLIERIEYNNVERHLRNLGERAAIPKRANARRAVAKDGGFLPVRLANGAARPKGEFQVMANYEPPKSFVMDYTLMTSQTNFTFRGDSTYYIASDVNLSALTSLEGGAVLKFSPSGPTHRLRVNGPLDCRTTPFNPAFFTARDDDTLGEAISGSTGIPSGYYGTRCLDLNSASTNYVLHDLRFRYIERALSLSAASKVELSHSQFGYGGSAIYHPGTLVPVALRNVLIHNITTAFSSATNKSAENCTFHQIANLGGNSMLSLTNCLVISVTNGLIFEGTHNETNQSDSGIFQTVGAGARYLATNAYRNVGTTNINPSLLNELKARTTYVPQLLGGPITVSTTLVQQVARDSDGQPDLGYHYDPIDWCASALIVTNAELKLDPGVVLAGYSNDCVVLHSFGSFAARGMPLQRSIVTRYNMIQEEANSDWAYGDASTYLVRVEYDHSPATFDLRYARMTVPAGSAMYHYESWSTNETITVINAELFNGRFALYGGGVLQITNDFFHRFGFYIETCSGGAHAYAGQFRNLTFLGGAIDWLADCSTMSITNSIFDNTTFNLYGDWHNSDYNGYVTNATRFSPDGTHDVVLTNTFVPFEAGVLGLAYLPSNSRFVNAGSAPASALGLYHFTTLTNNSPECESQVDLGYHVVALNVQGQPEDSNGDGIANYLADANGNGVVDAGETPYTAVSLSITSPTNGTYVAAPANISIDASASSLACGTFTWVELYTNGTLLVQDTTSPYGYSWNGVPMGVYTLVARARANSGLMATSAPVSITVNTPPSVSITSPTNNAFFAAVPTNITITATASDDSAVNQVEFFAGSTSLGIDTWPPYSVVWANVPSGTHSLTARATDDYGAVTTSAAVSITVSNVPPTIALTNPTNGVTFLATANITLVAAATDSGGSVTNVEFYEGSTKLGQDTSAPYSLPWTNIGVGTYVLKAVAADNSGLRTTSAVANVSVINSLSRTWTRNVDFAEGHMVNLNFDDVAHQLQLNKTTATYPYVWVPCSGRQNTVSTNAGAPGFADPGTVVRIDANTGQILGEYRTAPDGRYGDPSRTTVDKFGNVWVANRREQDDQLGSITRIGLVIGGTRGYRTNGNVFVPHPEGEYLKEPFAYSTVKDRDGDGYIRTSRGRGHILPWSNTNNVDDLGGVQSAEDEGIINYVRVDPGVARTIAVDANNDVWVGGDYGSSSSTHEKIDGVLGARILGTSFQTNAGGYGGLIDGYGVLWSARGGGQRNLLRFDPGTTNIQNLGNTNGNYGLGVDPNTGEIWHTDWDSPKVFVLSPAGVPRSTNYSVGHRVNDHVAYEPKGVVVDSVHNVWIALAKNGTTVEHFRTDGTHVGAVVLPCGVSATGVSVDMNGKIWASVQDSHKAMRIDPKAGPLMLGGNLNTNGFPVGAVDLTVDLGPDAAPYNYSDMTGFVTLSTTAPSGIWTVIHDSAGAGTEWGTVKWTEQTTNDTGIKVEVRAAASEILLTNDFRRVTNDVSFLGAGIAGRFLQMRVSLTNAFGSTNRPILYDLAVAYGTNIPVITTNAPYLAEDDTVVISQDSGTNMLDVLANDSDPAGHHLRIWKVSAPKYGTFTNTGTSIIYTPNTNFFGKDRFIYTVTNGNGGIGRGLVSLTVNGIEFLNQPPVANDDFFTMKPNSPYTILPVLTNDLNAARIVFAGQGRNGTVVLDATNDCVGRIHYQPNSYFLGTDSFTYAIINTNGVARAATVNVYIKGERGRVIECGQTLPASISGNDGYLVFHGPETGDIYSFQGTTNMSVNVYTYTNPATTDNLFLYSTIVGPAGTSVSSGMPLPVNGTYTIEIRSSPPATGDYLIELSCTNTSVAPEISVAESSRHITNYATLDFGLVLSGTESNRTVYLFNPGFGDLYITNYTATGPFSITETVVDPFLLRQDITAVTNVTVWFQPTSSGPQAGSLTITNNDSDENPFVINLKGWAGATGAPPAVAITTPTNGAVFGSPANIFVDAQATAASGVITQVLFYLATSNATTQIGIDTNSPHQMILSVPDGDYSLFAQAYDSNGRATNSPVVQFQVTTNIANQQPIAADDYFSVAMNTADSLLYVLANDTDPDGDSLTIITNTSVIGTMTNGGTYFAYTPPPDSLGTNTFSYVITDGRGGTAIGRAILVVTEGSPPTVAITNPAPNAQFTLPTTITIQAGAGDSDATVDKVDFYVDGELWATDSSSPYSTTWTDPFPGQRLWTAVATDSQGLSTISASVAIRVLGKPGNQKPIARINNLTNSVTTQGGFLIVPSYPTLREGLFTLVGTADDPDGADTVSYQVLVRTIAGNLAWSTTNQARVVSNTLATLDFSMLRNGVYDLELRVRDGYDVVSLERRFILDSELKIGHFSFSEQDLVIPVNGIPLTVTRTYNSLNPNVGDFGHSWTYVLNDLELELDEERGWNEDVAGEIFEQRVGGGRNVTLTMPDGRRATFVFDFQGGESNCPGCFHGYWKAPPGVFAKLSTPFANTNPTEPGDNTLVTLLGFPYWHYGGYYTPMEAYDFAGFVLTTQDGTKYEIDRPFTDPNGFFSIDDEGNDQFVLPRGKAKLKRIVQRTGDLVEINDSEIKHLNPSDGLTRSVFVERDSLGRISAIRDPISGSNGTPVVKYTYDEKGNLSEVTRLVDRTAGSYLTSRYFYTNANFPHYLTSIEDPRGITAARNLYDDSGRLIAIIDADGRTNRFHHDLIGRAETITNRLGDRTIHAYDTRGNVVQTIDALAFNTFRGYDTNNNLVYEANHFSQTNWFVYNSSNLVVATTNALGHTNGTVYNAFGQATITFDALGRGTTNSYDSKGNLTSTTDALGIGTTFRYDDKSQLTAQIDALGTVTTNVYDSLGNLTHVAVKNAAGQVLSTNSYAYDANGNRTNQTVTRTLADGSKQAIVTTYVYDGQNRLMHTIEPDGFTNIVVYNAIGQQEFTIDKLGRTNRLAYDMQGRLFKHTYPDGRFELSFYDAEGRRTNSVDRAGRSTSYLYDKLGRLTGTAYPDGATNQTVYDAAGRVQSTVDARGNVTAFGYDAAGRRTSVTNAYGTSIQAVSGYSLDAAGNLTNMVDALGRATDYEYDRLNRQVRTLYPATVSGGPRAVTLSGYDALGRRMAETNEAAVVTRFGYDSLGRLMAVTNAHGNPEAAWATYAYDEAGNQTNQVDALGRMTRYEFDSLGRRISRILPGAQKESFAYDPVGNLLRHTNFINSLVITNEYDLMNRLIRKWFGAVQFENYGYSATGQRTARTDESGSYTWVYDLRDRVRTNTTPVAALYYEYDRQGNLTNLLTSTASGTWIAYEYDALKRVTNVIDNRLTGTKNTAYSFDQVGNLKTIKYPTALTNLWEYDARNRLTNGVWKQTTTTRASFYYELAVAGNRTNLSEAVNGVNRTYSWSYDQLYRLTNELISGSGAVSYGYDRASNRTNRQSTISQLTTTNYTHNTNDWLTTDIYDENGNTRTNGSNTYAYDWANRLTNSGLISIVYNADGHRIKKSTATTTTLYLVDALNLTGYPQVLEEHTLSGSVTNLFRCYIYGLDLIGWHEGVLLRYCGYDGHGSVRFAVNGSGTVGVTYAYDAYGTVIASTGSSSSPYRYAGEQWDADLGLYFLRARYLNPNTGRFLTGDSFEGMQRNPISLHKYLYADGNPANKIDPSGHFSLIEQLAVSFVLAIVVTHTADQVVKAYRRGTSLATSWPTVATGAPPTPQPPKPEDKPEPDADPKTQEKNWPIPSVDEELDGYLQVHRMGGRYNLALSGKEKTDSPPGFSVLIGGTPESAAHQMRDAFKNATRLHALSRTVGSAEIAKIRSVGFDVKSTPDDKLPNHGTLFHQSRTAAAFENPVNLRLLSGVFSDTPVP